MSMILSLFIIFVKDLGSRSSVNT